MTKVTYDTDFYAWTQAQAAALRTQDWQALDSDHLAEEIEEVGKSHRHAVQSQLKTLVQHLLKATYQTPTRRSWLTSIDNARTEIDLKLRDSPSLRVELDSFLAWAYPRARKAAAKESGLPLATLPETCPWGLDQLLDEDYWPPDA
jgi:hypothetical protein